MRQVLARYPILKERPDAMDRKDLLLSRTIARRTALRILGGIGVGIVGRVGVIGAAYSSLSTVVLYR